MRHLLVLALASACVAVAADPPTALPDLVLERGETLVYAYPPYDTVATSDPTIVRIVERGKGLVELIGTAAGVVDVKLVATERGASVAYVSRIEVLPPLADVITDEIRAKHKDLSPAEQQRIAAEALVSARRWYLGRAESAPNLYQSYMLARSAWSLLAPHGPRSAMVMDAKDLMDKAKAELDTTFAQVSAVIDRAIQVRDWAALAAHLDALLRFLPDPRDRRHQRARKLRDFYADVLDRRDVNSEGVLAGGIHMQQFCDAVQQGVVAMEKGNFRDASTLLAAASALIKSQTVQRLIELNQLLAEAPVDHVDKILEITSGIMTLTDDAWFRTGVTAFARKTHELWTRERDHALSASRGDKEFDLSRYSEALDHYDKIARDSELYVVRLGKIETCKAKLTAALRDEAKALIAAALPEEANVKLREAMVIAPHDMQNELVVLMGMAQNNQKYAVLLRKGRAELRADNVDAATQFLEQIPDTSIYYEAAASELESIGLQCSTREARKLFALGEGAKALALLKDARDPSAVAFREKVDSVHQLYVQARELYHAEKYREANDLWDTLKRMVGDPTNQYYKWAEAGIKVDPVIFPTEYAKEAQEYFAAGKFLTAAKLNSRVLRFDPKNASALTLQKTIERQVLLRYAIERKKFESGSIDNPTFLKFALEQYVLLRAANAIHPQLPQMVEHIVKAGGEVPPEDR